MLIEPGKGYLFSVAWSPTRPTVIALGTAQGNVLMYDLQVRVTFSGNLINNGWVDRNGYTRMGILEWVPGLQNSIISL